MTVYICMDDADNTYGILNNTPGHCVDTIDGFHEQFWTFVCSILAAWPDCWHTRVYVKFMQTSAKGVTYLSAVWPGKEQAPKDQLEYENSVLLYGISTVEKTCFAICAYFNQKLLWFIIIFI